MEITNNYEKIKRLLEIKPKYRDDYNALLSRVWYDEMQNKSLSAIDFLHLLNNKQLSHPESIMRCRRKIQEEHPHLRGKTYKQRKTKEVKSVQTELGYGI